MSGRNNSTEKALKYVMSTRITVNPQVANIVKNNHFLKNFFYKNKVNLIVSKKINNYIYMYIVQYNVYLSFQHWTHSVVTCYSLDERVYDKAAVVAMSEKKLQETSHQSWSSHWAEEKI